MEIWDRLLVLAEGKLESNRPAVCECFLAWPFAPVPGSGRGEPVRGSSMLVATWRAAAAAVERAAAGVGREKL